LNDLEAVHLRLRWHSLGKVFVGTILGRKRKIGGKVDCDTETNQGARNRRKNHRLRRFGLVPSQESSEHERHCAEECIVDAETGQADEQEEPKKKRGFWGRIFGSRKDKPAADRPDQDR
jgi:hypothetical protein